MRNKFVSLLLCCILTLHGCAPVMNSTRVDPSYQISDSQTLSEIVETDSLTSLQDLIYHQTVETVGEQYFVENVEVRHISKEYLEELAYNSQENTYFGFTLAELESIYGDTSYLFTVDENGTTVTEAFVEYDSDFDEIVGNFAIGGGVILVCVTVSAATGGTAPAVSMIFAFAAKGAVTGGVVSGAIGAAAGAINSGIQGENPDEIIHAALKGGSEGFKYGAIAGAIEGGASEAIGLYGASRNGLTINQAARIQHESGWSLDVIKSFHSDDEYQVYRAANLHEVTINGRKALVQDIDWSIVDEDGLTNAERVAHGLAPIDANGNSYELHHIGQSTDSPLAILTPGQHRMGSNYSALHNNEGPGVQSSLPAGEWNRQRNSFWKAYLEYMETNNNGI